MQPDAIIKVRFKTTAEGGRHGNVVIANKPYACVMFIDAEAFDCRFLINNQTLELGETYELPVKFLNPDLALPMLSLGKPMRIWEGKDIATGELVRLV